MAIGGIDLSEYAYTPVDDKDEPKTKFHMKPMIKMEFFNVASVFNKLNVKDSVKIEMGDSSDVIYGYIIGHCTKVENFLIDGQPKNGPITEFSDRIGPLLALEIVGDALKRTNIGDREAKNSS